LSTAETIVDAQPSADISGFLSIRGSVELQLDRRRDTVHTYRRVLEMRQAHGANPEQVAEIKAELGFALMITGHLREAGRLLEEGVDILEKSHRGGFVIRAKKKLAFYYLSVGAWRDAYRQTLEAEALSKYLRYGWASLRPLTCPGESALPCLLAGAGSRDGHRRVHLS
jgi:hypothetical protein